MGTFPSASGDSAFFFLPWPRPRTPRENQASILEDDFSYLANLTDGAFEEELPTLAYYNHRSYVVLTIDGDNCKEVFMANQLFKER